MLRKVTVLYNLPGESTTQNIKEADDDTERSALNIAEGLKDLKYDVEVLGITRNEIEKVKTIKTDLVFNMIEWAGRECNLAVHVLNMLQDNGIPFTGSNAEGYMLSCDKVKTKKRMLENNISTPKYLIAQDTEFKIRDSGLVFPIIVKPSTEHCAIGITQKSVVTTESELTTLINKLYTTYKQPLIVEEYIQGDEAQVTVLEKNGQPWVLPPAVFRYRTKKKYWPINTYAAKWTDGWESKMSAWIDAASLSEPVLQKIHALAQLCYTCLSGRSYPRIDMRINGNQVYVLEINNNPGIDFDPESGIAHSAVQAGLDWLGLLQNIVTESYKNPAI